MNVAILHSHRSRAVLDGLWDVMSPERVLHCCTHTAKSPDMLAKRLLTEALDRGTDDNTTVVVVFLQDLK